MLYGEVQPSSTERLEYERHTAGYEVKSSDMKYAFTSANIQFLRCSLAYEESTRACHLVILASMLVIVVVADGRPARHRDKPMTVWVLPEDRSWPERRAQDRLPRPSIWDPELALRDFYTKISRLLCYKRRTLARFLSFPLPPTTQRSPIHNTLFISLYRLRELFQHMPQFVYHHSRNSGCDTFVPSIGQVLDRSHISQLRASSQRTRMRYHPYLPDMRRAEKDPLMETIDERYEARAPTPPAQPQVAQDHAAHAAHEEIRRELPHIVGENIMRGEARRVLDKIYAVLVRLVRRFI